MTKPRVPANVMVQGQQCPTSVEGGKIKTEITDPRGPVKHSPYAELLPATDEWITKHGGSDVDIVAYNVSELLCSVAELTATVADIKEKANADNRD